MKQNRQKITKLQQENKELYKQKADKLKVCYTGTKLVHYWVADKFAYTFCVYFMCPVFVI